MSGHPILPSEPITLPLLPLRDVVVFPHMVIPLFVGRPKSIKALEAAMEAGRQIMLVAQKAAGKDEPRADDMFEVGCISSILQMLKLPDGTVKVLVEGKARVKITEFVTNPSFFEARAEMLAESMGDKDAAAAMTRSVSDEFEKYAKIKKNIPEEALAAVADTHEPARLADLVAGHLGVEVSVKQELLETLVVAARVE
jgi:ATP-dependent Lon protease